MIEMLTHVGLWPKPRLSQETTEKIESAVKQAKDESYALANELELLGASDDPFAVFAHRARNARFRKMIEKGDAD